MLATRLCRCSIGIFSNLSSRTWAKLTKILGRVVLTGDCTAQIIPNMGLQSDNLAGWRRCPTEGNQGLPKHSELWHYHLGSRSYPRNAAWQMTPRCFVECPCRAHWWGICRGAQEAIGYHCEKLPRSVPTHHQLGHYKLGTFAGIAH